MSKVNPSAVILSRKGEPMTLSGPDSEQLTIGLAVQMAVDSALEGDDKLSSETKLKHDRIARKFAADEPFEVSGKDATTILERCNKMWGALVYGQLVEALDPAQIAD